MILRSTKRAKLNFFWIYLNHFFWREVWPYRHDGNVELKTKYRHFSKDHAKKAEVPEKTTSDKTNLKLLIVTFPLERPWTRNSLINLQEAQNSTQGRWSPL